MIGTRVQIVKKKFHIIKHVLDSKKKKKKKFYIIEHVLESRMSSVNYSRQI